MPVVAIVLFILLLGFSGGLNTNDSTDPVVPKSDTSSANLISSQTGSFSDEKEPVKQTNKDEIPAERTEFIDLRTPLITLFSAQNIEANSVSIRSEVDMHSHETGKVFVVYGYDKNEVDSLVGSYNQYADIPDTFTDEARVQILDSRAKGVEVYDKGLRGLIADAKYFFKVCVEYSVSQSDIVCSYTDSFTTNPSTSRNNYFNEPRVSTDREGDVTAYTAELKGDVRMNDGKDGIAFLVYGEDEELVREIPDEYEEYSDIREDEEDLQKIRLAVRLIGESEYVRVVDDLDRDTDYYYSFCVEFDGDESGLKCGSVRNFTTDRKDNDDVPNVSVEPAFHYSGGVRITGQVNMRDYNSGLVFFVYGTDESWVDEVTEDSSFDRVNQRGDQLQKRLVDKDHDGSDSFTLSLSDLNPQTEYSYSLCVEFEGEDENNRETLHIECSSVGVFEVH